MNRERKAFLYFIFLAPVLAKIIEWIFQSIGGFLFISNGIWLFQLIFIVLLSLGLYGVFKFFKLSNPYAMSFIPAIAYFLKEVYNLIAITHIVNYSTLFALTVEPIFFWVVVGYIPYRIFFGGKK